MDPSTKRCKTCGSTGPFGKRTSAVDKLESCCKPCLNAKQKQRNTTPAGKAATAWQSILKRANNRNGSNPTYVHVNVGISREAFMAWAIQAFTTWIDANPNGIPSVNRIIDTVGYVVENLEVISAGDNSQQRPFNRNVHAPLGLAWCARCKEYLPRSKFRVSLTRAHGLEHHCKTCSREYHRIYAREYRSRNLETIRKYQRDWKRKSTKNTIT